MAGPPLHALACLAAVATVGALLAGATLLPAGGRARRAVRAAGAAAVVWALLAVALLVATAPLGGLALGDPAAGAAVAAWAVGGGAATALGALSAAGLATALLVRPPEPPGAVGALAVAVLAAAPLGVLPGGGDALLLPGSRRAAVVVAGWLALVGAGGWLAAAVVARAARGQGPTVRRCRSLSRWVAPLVLVLAAVAVAGALVPTAAAPTVPPTAAGVLALTGAPPPPLPVTAARAVLQVAPDPLWLLVTAGATVAYLLAARTTPWSRGRSAAWCTGCLVTAWVTCGGPAAYAPLLPSVQMLVHAVLVVAAAPLLVAGAPRELVERAVAPRQDGSSGVREVVGALSGTRSAAAARRPVVALVLLLAVLATIWATPLLPAVLGTLAGHEAATAAVLCAGALAAAATGGEGPTGPAAAPAALPGAAAGAARPSRPAAAALLPVGLTIAVAGAGTWLATTQRLLAAGWSSRLGLGVDALADQRAGALAIVAVVVAGCALRVAVMILPVTIWARTPARTSARDR